MCSLSPEIHHQCISMHSMAPLNVISQLWSFYCIVFYSILFWKQTSILLGSEVNISGFTLKLTFLKRFYSHRFTILCCFNIMLIKHQTSMTLNLSG